MVKLGLIIVATLLAMTLLAGCTAGSARPAAKPDNSTVTDGVMTTSVDDESKPTSPVKDTFTTDTPVVYCSFKVNGVQPEDMIKVGWYYVKGEATGKENELLNETYTIAQSSSDSYYLAFYYDKPVSGWYKGEYKVVIYVNGVEKLTVPFKIN